MIRLDRIPCEVLGCRRTAPKAKYAEGTRIICGKCWRLASIETRKAYAAANKVERRLQHIEDMAPEHVSPGDLAELALAREAGNRAFWQVRDQANEAKAGLG